MKKPRYADLADLPENKRIQIIGERAMKGEVIAFVVEDDRKADRYLKKIANRFPKIVQLARVPGPIEGAVTVKVGLPETEN